MREFMYTVQDELGLHARPAGLLAKKAAAYNCDVTLQKGDKSVSAKKLFAVMGLMIKQGESVVFQMDGESEDQAYKDLLDFCEKNF